MLFGITGGWTVNIRRVIDRGRSFVDLEKPKRRNDIAGSAIIVNETEISVDTRRVCSVSVIAFIFTAMPGWMLRGMFSFGTSGTRVTHTYRTYEHIYITNRVLLACVINAMIRTSHNTIHSARETFGIQWQNRTCRIAENEAIAYR